MRRLALALALLVCAPAAHAASQVFVRMAESRNIDCAAVIGDGTGPTRYAISSAFTASPGSNILVYSRFESPTCTGAIDSLKWGATKFTAQFPQAKCGLWTASQVSGRTDSLIVYSVANGAIDTLLFVVVEITSAGTIDRTKSQVLTNTTDSSGVTVLATSQANEAILVGVGKLNVSPGGALDSSFVRIASVSHANSGNLSVYYKTVSAIGKYGFTRTGATNNPYATHLSTWRWNPETDTRDVQRPVGGSKMRHHIRVRAR